MDIQRIKDYILDLAIRGKLVEQDRNDETASELLKKIQIEKAKLVKEGKIKKEKELPSIQDRGMLFEIPSSWKWIKLVQISYLKSGNTYATEMENKKGGIPYLKVSDMNLLENHYEIKYSSRFIEKESDNKLIPKNSIIFPKRGGAILTNKKRLVLKQNILVDLNIMAIIPIEPETLMYIYYFFLTINLGNLNNGSTVPQINNSDIEKLLISLPPIEEQKRIVAKIEELFNILDNLDKEQIEYNKLLNILKNKTLDLAIKGKLVEQDSNDESASELLKKIQLIKKGEIKREKQLPTITKEEILTDLPDNWCWVRLNDICSPKQWKTISTDKLLDEGYPLYGANGIIGYYSEYNHEKPTILITCRGATCGSIIKTQGKCYVNGNAMSLDNLIEYVDVDYLKIVLFAMDFSKIITGTAQPQITQTKLNPILIPLPPLEEQKRIVNKIQEIFNIIEQV